MYVTYVLYVLSATPPVSLVSPGTPAYHGAARLRNCQGADDKSAMEKYFSEPRARPTREIFRFFNTSWDSLFLTRYLGG